MAYIKKPKHNFFKQPWNISGDFSPTSCRIFSNCSISTSFTQSFQLIVQSQGRIIQKLQKRRQAKYFQVEVNRNYTLNNQYQSLRRLQQKIITYNTTTKLNNNDQCLKVNQGNLKDKGQLIQSQKLMMLKHIRNKITGGKFQDYKECYNNI